MGSQAQGGHPAAASRPGTLTYKFITTQRRKAPSWHRFLRHGILGNRRLPSHLSVPFVQGRVEQNDLPPKGSLRFLMVAHRHYSDLSLGAHWPYGLQMSEAI